MADDDTRLTSSSSCYKEILGEPSQKTFLVANLTGVNGFSLIFNLLDENLNEINFNNQKYCIFASNSAYDEIPFDPTSYYEIMIRPEKFPHEWVMLKELSLGTESNCTQSFDSTNWQNTASPTHWKYVKVAIDGISQCRIRIILSGR